jgi:hypothetical protein
MANTSQNPQYNSAYTTLMNNRNWAFGVLDLDRAYAMPLAWIDSLNPQGSYSIEGPEGQLLVAYQPRAEVVQTIASVTQVGANLLVTFIDSSYDSFREKFLVMDDNKNFAYVIQSQAGSVLLKPATNPLTLVAASHFVAGRTITEVGNIAGNQQSTGVANLYKTKAVRSNWSSIMRESCTISSREKFNTYGYDEKIYAYTQNESEMVKRFMKRKLMKAIYHDPGQFNTQFEGTGNVNQSLRAAVRDQGGMFIQSSSLLSQSMFESMLDFVATKDPAQYQDYVFIGGRAAWGRISSFYQNNIIYTQSTKMANNGQAVTFDIAQVTIKGITLKIQVWGLFNDNVLFPKVSTIAGAGYKEANTFAILNLNPVPDAMSGGMIPAVRKFHFGSSDATGGAEILYRTIPGMVGSGNSNSTGLPTVNGYQIAASSTMGSVVEMAEDAGIDFTADGCVWFELTA